MIVAYAGHDALDDIAARRLAGAFEVRRIDTAAAVIDLPSECEVLVLGRGAGAEIRERLENGGLKVRTVIDQGPGDGDRTRAFAEILARRGITLVDAPIHCELASAFPEASATLCGGPTDAIERVRPILEAICPKMIYFGETGAGQTAYLLVAAAAACNRMSTYESAAIGFKNGLGVAEMALVFNKSSSANSASERVLPHLGAATGTTDRPITAVVEELRLASRLAMQAGAPLILANLVGDLSQGLANQLGEGATFDDAVACLEAAAGIRFVQ